MDTHFHYGPKFLHLSILSQHGRVFIAWRWSRSTAGEILMQRRELVVETDGRTWSKAGYNGRILTIAFVFQAHAITDELMETMCFFLFNLPFWSRQSGS